MRNPEWLRAPAIVKIPAKSRICAVLAVKDDVPPDPMDVRFLGAAAVMTRADRVANAIEQLAGSGVHRRSRSESRANLRTGPLRSDLQPVRGRDGSKRPIEPQGAAQSAGSRGWTRHRQPLFVDRV